MEAFPRDKKRALSSLEERVISDTVLKEAAGDSFIPVSSFLNLARDVYRVGPTHQAKETQISHKDRHERKG